MNVERIDVFSPEFKANPYPTYAYLRENAPVYRAEPPGGPGIWLITRYADAVAVLKDDRFVKDIRNAMSPEALRQMPQKPDVLQQLSQSMIDMDQPDHTRLKSLVHKGFTPRLIERLRGRIQQLADELIDAAEEKGEMDLIADYAYPLPITVIMELLGLPVEDRDRFRAWSEASTSGTGIADPDESQLAAVVALTDYLKQMIAARRREPKDDLLSALVQAEEAGDKLNETELLAMIFLLLIAGHETTSNLIGNGMLALLQNPDQLALLRSNLSLVGTAVEELLRYSGPLEMTTERYAGRDVELAGTVIPRGEMALVALASANRDPGQFAEPDRLDITRSDNRHIAFGQGVHYCLGAPLARLEGQIGFTALLRRLPRLQLGVPAENVAWRPHLVLRGLERLPVVF